MFRFVYFIQFYTKQMRSISVSPNLKSLPLLYSEMRPNVAYAFLSQVIF
jgi:hypothetical protein